MQSTKEDIFVERLSIQWKSVAFKTPQWLLLYTVKIVATDYKQSLIKFNKLELRYN